MSADDILTDLVKSPNLEIGVRILFFLFLLGSTGIAAAQHEIDDKVEAAMQAESRPTADRERDDNRLPLQTLNFFGLRDDMRVIELLPGGGWYTRILAPVLADNGHLYVAINTDTVNERVLSEPGFDKVTVLDDGWNLRRPDGSAFYSVDDHTFGVDNVDMVLTFRNLHNFDAESRKRINQAVFDALKSGGVYGVVDHTRRHMESDNGENRRRIDPVLVIREMLELGFEFEAFSDLHFRADDELEYEVGRRSVSGNTDRFTLLFRKP
jgi:predicted methyltransferase